MVVDQLQGYSWNGALWQIVFLLNFYYSDYDCEAVATTWLTSICLLCVFFETHIPLDLNWTVTLRLRQRRATGYHGLTNGNTSLTFVFCVPLYALQVPCRCLFFADRLSRHVNVNQSFSEFCPHAEGLKSVDNLKESLFTWGAFQRTVPCNAWVHLCGWTFS